MNPHLNLEQLAKLFGVSLRHLYRLRAAGNFPDPVRIGGRNCWDPAEVAEYFKNTSNSPTAKK